MSSSLYVSLCAVRSSDAGLPGMSRMGHSDSLMVCSLNSSYRFRAHFFPILFQHQDVIDVLFSFLSSSEFTQYKKPIYIPVLVNWSTNWFTTNVLKSSEHLCCPFSDNKLVELVEIFSGGIMVSWICSTHINMHVHVHVCVNDCSSAWLDQRELLIWTDLRPIK